MTLRVSKFAIWHQVEPPVNRPYRVIETYDTSDGWRTRVCDGAHRSFLDAQADLDQRIAKASPTSYTPPLNNINS